MSLAPAIPSAPKQESSASRWLRASWFVFAVALALRLALVFNFHLYRYPANTNHFQFGWEMGRIARAIASGRGYADPFYGHTGPSAWVPPLYPYLMAGVFRLFGIYSVASALTIMLFNGTVGALTVFPMRAIARRCFGNKVAIASIWAWAVWPFAMRYVGHPRDTVLTAFLFTSVLALTLHIRGIGATSDHSTRSAGTLGPWLLLGLLWGVIALDDPALLLVLPPSLLWILAGAWRGRDHSLLRRQLLRATFACLLCIGCMAPWTIRNAVVFHTFLPMRSDFGAELYLGNGPGSNGQLMIWEHPYDSPQQYSLYRSMGEVAYCRMRGTKAMAFIDRHPGHFLLDSLRRVDYFWFGLPQPSRGNFLAYAPVVSFLFVSLCGLLGLGLAFRNRIPATGLFASAIALYPVTYYLVVINPRFRHPLDPLLYILALYLWISAEESNRVRLLTPSWWRARFHAQ